MLSEDRWLRLRIDEAEAEALAEHGFPASGFMHLVKAQRRAGEAYPPDDLEAKELASCYQELMDRFACRYKLR